MLLLLLIENNNRTIYQSISSFLFCGAIIRSATDGCIDRFFPTIYFFVEYIALLTTLSAAFPTFCDVEVAPFTRYTHAHTDTHTNICMHVYLYTCIPVYMTCIHVYICTCRFKFQIIFYIHKVAYKSI